MYNIDKDTALKEDKDKDEEAGNSNDKKVGGNMQ